MEECVVSISETVTVFLNPRRRHGRIAEPRVVLKNRRPAIRNIALRRGESIVITVLSNLAERRRRWCVYNYGPMRTTGHREGQQKGCECDPLLHGHVLRFWD